MFDLTRQEKLILIFLSLSFAAGLGIGAYKKSQSKIELSIQPYEIAARRNADQLIAEGAFVNINTAGPDELMRLPGIGRTLAERISAYRRDHGRFSAKEQLLYVNGIGAKKFEALADLITLE